MLYPYEFVPDAYREFLALNPLTPLFIEARRLVIDPHAPTAVDAIGGWENMAISIAIAVAVCAISVWYFKRQAPRVAEEL